MDHPISADSRLSNYRLERLLGSGGMGEVYLARDLALDRFVAIKFIAPAKAGDASARRRLIREARAAASLDHPNICGVHDVIDTPDGRACIVMQYVEGRTLADVLRDGPMDVRLALTVAADLVSALAVAHKHGVVHRDLKPRNVIITPDSRAKLLDFGIARQASASADADDATTTTQLTTPGVIVGTPSYMSPEQVLQRPLDGRSDLFALGAVLFECLTGRRPFEGGGGLEQVSEVLHHEPPPVSSLRSGLSDRHDELVRRLLAKAPENRFGSAEEVLGALRVLLPEESSTRWKTDHEKRRGPASWLGALRSPRGAFAVIATLLMVAAVGVWGLNTPRATFEGTPEAQNYYDVGTEWIRRGAYGNGRRALTDAVRAAPGFVPAYVRLAEASSELDDYVAARDALLTVDDLMADVRNLDIDDRLRLEGVRSLVLRKMEHAIEAFEQLARRHPQDAGALVDLGRMQEASGSVSEATGSYERALQVDPNYAAAHLRLARTLADRNDRSALTSFARAEELFAAESNVEGQIETVLRRGAYQDAIGELSAARASVQWALDLAEQLGHHEQAVRARLLLSSITASEGRFQDAQRLAADAVQQAIDSNLDTVAADGLIDLANVLLYRQQRDANAAERLKAIEAHLARATVLANQRDARRTRARAALQLASVKAQWDDDSGALQLAEEQLPFLRQNGLRRFELQALLIMSRAHEGLGNHESARQLAAEVMTDAEEIGDWSQEGRALDVLAAHALATGALPEAEVFRRRAEVIHRKQNDAATLPYDLTNRAELLIRLGRFGEAVQLLAEVQRGIEQKVDSYLGRARRTKSLLALAAAAQHRFRDVQRLATEVLGDSPGAGDSAGRLCSGLLAYADASTSRRINSNHDPIPETEATSPAGREARYWDLAARLAAREVTAVKTQALETLRWKDAGLSPEYEWRIAAVAAAAAKGTGDTATATEMRTRALAGLSRIRDRWKEGAVAYERRPDIRALKSKAGLNEQP